MLANSLIDGKGVEVFEYASLRNLTSRCVNVTCAVFFNGVDSNFDAQETMQTLSDTLIGTSIANVNVTVAFAYVGIWRNMRVLKESFGVGPISIRHTVSCTLDSQLFEPYSPPPLPPTSPPEVVCDGGVSCCDAVMPCIEDTRCLDPTACNFLEPQSCVFCTQCDDSTASNYDSRARFSTACVYSDLLCDDSNSISFGSFEQCLYEVCTNGTLSYTSNASEAQPCVVTISGCTDIRANNYQSFATVDDGSCHFVGCMDSMSTFYNSLSTVNEQCQCEGPFRCPDKEGLTIGGDNPYMVPSDQLGRRRLQSTNETLRVSILILTCGRYPLLKLALQEINLQTYTDVEVVVVDDSAVLIDTIELSSIVRTDYVFQHVRLESRYTIGEKRNIGVSAATGSIIAHWDDDDWYSPERIRLQARAMIIAHAQLSTLSYTYLLDVDNHNVYVPRRLSIFMGSLMYYKFVAGIYNFPNISLGEDVYFSMIATRACYRHVSVSGIDSVYVRRQLLNTWIWSFNQTGNNLQHIMRPHFITDQFIYDRAILTVPCSVLNQYTLFQTIQGSYWPFMPSTCCVSPTDEGCWASGVAMAQSSDFLQGQLVSQTNVGYSYVYSPSDSLFNVNTDRTCAIQIGLSSTTIDALSQVDPNGAGCMIPGAVTYNPQAEFYDPCYCLYSQLGCMDPFATNYRSYATIQPQGLANIRSLGVPFHWL